MNPVSRVTDESGRVCILETTFKPDFELPGGIVEPNESPAAGLVREMAEEMGTVLDTGRILQAGHRLYF